MEKIISFIIPAYNMEEFLGRCLNSFCCSEIMRQLEIIVVDDGSVDRTGEIADQYAREYPDTFRVIHKKNGGHGSAINVGSREAKGIFFKVVDSDDWVVTENLPAFIAALKKSEADVVLTAFDMVDMKTNHRIKKRIDTKGKIRRFTMQEILDNVSYFEPCAVFHGITYRTKFYQEQEYSLAEHVFYEDQEYSTIPFCNARMIEVYPICIYQYMVGNDKQSIAFSNQAKRIDHLETIIQRLGDYYRRGYTDTAASQGYLLYKLRAIVLIYYATALVFERDRRLGRKFARRMHDRVKKQFPEINESTSKRYQVYCLISKLHIKPELYQTLVQSKLYFRLKHGRRTIGSESFAKDK